MLRGSGVNWDLGKLTYECYDDFDWQVHWETGDCFVRGTDSRNARVGEDSSPSDKGIPGGPYENLEAKRMKGQNLALITSTLVNFPRLRCPRVKSTPREWQGELGIYLMVMIITLALEDSTRFQQSPALAQILRGVKVADIGDFRQC